MFNHISKPRKYAAAGVAAVALALGAYGVGSSSSGNGGNGTANAAQAGPPGAPSGRFQRNGQRPPGFGTPVTGADAAKVKAAALARYSGTIQQIMKLPDGSYVAHVITSNGELHVAVSKDYKVTGARQGGPGAGGPPGGGAPPMNGGQSLPGKSS
ncbi:MAG: hypothetical protein QOF37_2285 [Thermoleophilaceae bacterium]|jgi:hypothetical protein|nr:hypothetical protein [Thermoleophilaceae bacterium]